MSRSSLLWKIIPPGGDKPSWVFGTMHIRDDRAHQFSAGLYPLILQADVFFGEMDLDEMPPGIPMPAYDISLYFSERKFDKIRRQMLKSFGLDLAHVKHLHPLIIMGMVSTSGLETEHRISLDEHLWQFAKLHGKPVKGLESYEEQFRILHSIDPVPMYRQIAAMSRHPHRVNSVADKSLDLYIAGDVHKLYQLSKKSMGYLRKKVIYERNRKMADVINHLEVYMQYFITVGAGHLSGHFGLLSLLKKSGWQVKPVQTFVSLEEQSGTE